MLGWIGAAGAAGIMLVMHEMPPDPLIWTGALCLAMALARSAKAFGIWWSKRRLRGGRLRFISLGKLAGQQMRHPGRIWLGNGFDWGQPHAQGVHEILKHDKHRALPGKSLTGMGAGWIHGLGTGAGILSLPREHAAGHVLIVGTTGSGKTRLFDHLITQSILAGHAVVIVDPKGDRALRDNARRACEFVGDPGRFVNFHPAFPQESARIDPLRRFNRGTEVASRIAALIPSETGSDPFKAFGMMALNNIVQGLLLVNRRPTLVSLRRYLDAGVESLVIQAIESWSARHDPDWRDRAGTFTGGARRREAIAKGLIRYYREHLEDFAPSPDLGGLITMYEHDRTHFAKMVASLLPIMTMLTSGELASLLSPDLSDETDRRDYTTIERVINLGQTLYLGLDSLSDPMVGAAIGSMFVAELTATAGARYNYGVDNRQVDIFIDEAAEVLAEPAIALLNKSRGSGFTIFMATQSVEDLSARLGSPARANQVLANLNNTIALRVIDGATQKFLADNMPKTRVRYVMRQQGTGTESGNPALHTGSVGERLMEEEADLVAPQVFGMLPNLEFFAKLSAGRIVKGKLPILRGSE
ncbi:MAG: conjugative transfer system coupling protein TraD [Pseudomonadota bacterium]|nr:conjugative transfer system coupling protein TraD [Pseudomonadota bacterium]